MRAGLDAPRGFVNDDLVNRKDTTSTLVYTVALNGYHWRYAELIQSQRDYAARHRYSYACVNRPLINPLGLETAWLKLSLALAALEAGYETVFYVDADARIRPQTPALETLFAPEKHVYAARGYSDRINSGILLFRKSPATCEKLREILDNIDRDLPESDEVGWGENGHVIHYLNRWPGFAELPAVWNNNHTAALPDFIRHYSAGPLRAEFAPRRHLALAALLCAKLANSLRRLRGLTNTRATVAQHLPALTAQALHNFPILRKR